jgi:hypothetical protein
LGAYEVARPVINTRLIARAFEDCGIRGTVLSANLVVGFNTANDNAWKPKSPWPGILACGFWVLGQVADEEEVAEEDDGGWHEDSAQHLVDEMRRRRFGCVALSGCL